MTEVIVVGSGPAGMMLAGELALAGVDVRLLERRESAQLVGSRAGGFHARTLEILDQRGIGDRFVAAGQPAQTARFGSTTLDIGALPTPRPYGLALWQDRIEPLLAAWIAELGVRVERGAEVVGLAQDATGVDLRLADGRAARAAWVVGADGGRSTIRRSAGIDFPGWDATGSTLIGEVEVAEEPPSGVHQDTAGVHGLHPLGAGRYRVVTAERVLAHGEATLDDLRASLRAALGSDFGVHAPVWLSRFTDATRQAAEYRRGRVLLVGDAAHIHYPAGGQGIGLGIQDAVNLGFKLARVARGVAPATLLDTYHSERHPADARALQLSMAGTALQRRDPRVEALATVVDDLLGTAQGSELLAARIHGLDVDYAPEAWHPLVGRRVPDVEVVTDGGPVRAFALLHEARGVLIDLIPGRAWDDARVPVVRGRVDEPWVLPVMGEVEAPTAVLVRPDGHVAWVENAAPEPVDDAIERWFGVSAIR